MKTARVRVLVAVTDDGTWYAEGASDTRRKRCIAQMQETIHNYMTPPIDFYWIEADVPVPAPLNPTTIGPVTMIPKGASRPKRRPVMTRSNRRSK